MNKIAGVVPMSPPPGEITLLLSDLQQGNTAAADKLMPLVYRHLHQMAAYYFQHERPGHTLQPTVLVHEAYIRLMKPGQAHWKNRAHFYGVAARAMRQILVEHSRAHKAEKRGGGREKLELD
jgi:RNA polymerase sigma-70 factor, ECF subfamily